MQEKNAFYLDAKAWVGHVSTGQHPLTKLTVTAKASLPTLNLS
jgi:hypothetical protein